MSTAALRLPRGLSVDEFQDWRPPTGLEHHRWQLVDGEPVGMAPASENHGAIQNQLGRLLADHLASVGSPCRVITAPGVIPRVRAHVNERVPDLGVTCAPARGSRAIVDPVLLVEILSPSNAADTRANVWAYTSIPTVTEILLLSDTSILAELLRREAGGAWPDGPALVGAGDVLRLDSIGFAGALRDVYATTSLV